MSRNKLQKRMGIFTWDDTCQSSVMWEKLAKHDIIIPFNVAGFPWRSIEIILLTWVRCMKCELQKNKIFMTLLHMNVVTCSFCQKKMSYLYWTKSKDFPNILSPTKCKSYLWLFYLRHNSTIKIVFYSFFCSFLPRLFVLFLNGIIIISFQYLQKC